MANYVEYIKVGNGETWPIRDKETAEALTTLEEQMNKALGEILLNAHPVGSYYISENDTSPADLFGGTWVQIKDTFLLAAGDKYTAGSTGGEEKHTLSINEMPSHNHVVQKQYLHRLDSTDDNYANFGNAGDLGGWGIRDTDGNKGTTRLGIPQHHTNNTGGGQAHNNMPPYLTVYVWKRTE